MSDILSLVIRVMILFTTAMASQIAFHRKLYSLAFFLFAFWVSMFRLTLFRVTNASMGVFSHSGNAVVIKFSNLLLSSQTSNYTDFLLLIALIPLVVWIVNSKINEP